MQSEISSSAGAGAADATLALSPRLVQSALREATTSGVPAMVPFALTSITGNTKAPAATVVAKPTAPFSASVVATAAAVVRATTTPIVATVDIRLASPVVPPAAENLIAGLRVAAKAGDQPVQKPEISNFPTPQRKSVQKLRASAAAAPLSKVSS